MFDQLQIIEENNVLINKKKNSNKTRIVRLIR